MHAVSTRLLLLSLVALALGACSSRTSAATQPSPAAFDPSQSEPKALELADAMIAKLGGAERWEQVKQICWDQKYTFEGEMRSWFKHCWDRWNGRHRFEMAQMDTVKEAETQGKPNLIKFQVAMYDLFDRGRGWAGIGNHALGAEDKEKLIGQAYDRWKLDAYGLTMLYKLKDPGVKLAFFGEVNQLGNRDDLCKPVCDTLKVSFVPELGSDAYYVHIDRASGLPVAVERPHENTRIGYALGEWTEVGGLKWPQRLQNIGLPAEVIVLERIQIAEPDDALYIPQVL